MHKRHQLIALSTAFVAIGTGCSASMKHLEVPIPIVLGDRLHVGTDPTFRRAELLELYFAEERSWFTGSPYGGDSDHAHNTNEVASAIAETSRERAVLGVKIRGSVTGHFVLLGGGSDETLNASGSVIGILQAASSESQEDR